MHQLPAGVEQALLRQPGDRALAGGGEAVVDLGSLLGDMEVDRPGKACGQLAQPLHRRGCRRPQGVQRQPGLQQRPAAGRDALGGGPHAVGGAGEAPLVVAQGGLAETGALVQRGHQRQAQTGRGGGVGQGPAQRQRVGIGPAVRVVLQVVEFTDLGVAAAQQFEVQHRGDGLQLIGRDAQGHAVHAVAPRPEVVGRGLAPLGQPGEGTLEGMAVGIDQAGQQRATQHLRAGRRLRHAGGDGSPTAVWADLQQHVGLPVVLRPGRPGRAGKR